MTKDNKAYILLIDDEQDFLDLLATRLRNRDMHVETALSGEQGLKKAMEARFDIIVIDLAMPGMDGIETITHIKKAKPHAEVIILTGHADVKHSVQAMKVGAEDFLEKPVDMEVLLNKIILAQERTIQNYEKTYSDEVAEIVKKRSW